MSVVLFFVFNQPVLFFILYIIGGMTDVLDGYVARLTNTQSELGAKLDSVADILLFGIILMSVIRWMGKDIIVYIPLLAAIAVIRLVNLAIAAYKYHTFAIIHTIGNKAAGFLLFFAPVIIRFKYPWALWVMCILALLSALEETLIHITSGELDINRPSILKK
jgi:CDP-diacylglycerol--glycerol-3-phosphate 3-phosphatidyltransferase